MGRRSSRPARPALRRSARAALLPVARPALLMILIAGLLALVFVVGAAAEPSAGETPPTVVVGGGTAGESGGPAGPSTTTAPPETGTTLTGETRVTSTTSPSTTVPHTNVTLPASTSPAILERLRQLELLAGTISAKQMEVYRAAIELDAMDEDLSLTVEEYNYRVLALDEAMQKVARLQNELGLSREELTGATASLEERVVGAYKSDASVLEVLLDSTGMSDLIRRLGLLVTIVKSDRERLDEVTALRARADRLLDELSPQIYEVTVASDKLVEQKKSVEEKLAVRQAYLDQLSAEIRGLVDQQRQITGDVVPAGFDVGTLLAGDANAVVKTALRYLGVPYVWGGALPTTGFDCSGLVQYVFQQNGMYAPHYSGYQALMGIEVPRDGVLPGDLVFFGAPVHHVGIYVGQDLFVHAPRTGDVVRLSRLSERVDVSHIRRVVVPSTNVASALVR